MSAGAPEVDLLWHRWLLPSEAEIAKLLCRQVNQEILERLRQVLNPSLPAEQSNIFVLDGSTLELESSRQLRSCYPPPHNQHGRSHWPLLRLVVMHDAG